jgi:asparagine synthase (glutamine-hydrolysing)
MGMAEIGRQLAAGVNRAVQRNPAQGLLLSGGLDSSILAIFAPEVKALTTGLKGAHAPDVDYGMKVAAALGLEHHRSLFSAEEAMAAVPKVIKALKTFDLALPNDIAIYFALKLAQERGIESVMTGDGADELFAGYSYMHQLGNKQLDSYIHKLAKTMRFSSAHLGRELGLEIKQPYLDREFIALALGIDPHWKVADEGGKIWGKWILRKAFETRLPRQIIWREKTPIEHGSGTSELRQLISARVSDFEVKKREYGIRFINKEHLFYYEIYREVVGEVPSAKEGEERCPCCGAAAPEPGYCPVCGACGPFLSDLD